MQRHQLKTKMHCRDAGWKEEKPCGDGQRARSILTEQHLLQLVSDDWSPRGVFKERVPKARENGDNYQLPMCHPHEVKTFPDVWSFLK